MSDSESQDRRAVDSPLWKEYVKSDISWPAAFKRLGPHFVTRVLLRRELFGEIKNWLDTPESEGHPELARMLADCRVTIEAFRNKDAPAEKIRELELLAMQMKKRMPPED